jgi:hypothetical protein
MGRLAMENPMTRHSPEETIAVLAAAASLRAEIIQQRVVWAWGQALFAELGRMWAQLDAAETLTYEDQLAAQVHVLDDATASLALLSHRLRRTSRRLARQLQSLRA